VRHQDKVQLLLQRLQAQVQISQQYPSCSAFPPCRSSPAARTSVLPAGIDQAGCALDLVQHLRQLQPLLPAIHALAAAKSCWLLSSSLQTNFFIST
jgi:hypothetical protein